MKKLVLIVALLACLTPLTPAEAQAIRLSIGSSGSDVTKVQYVLRSAGYSLAVDGQYGMQTAKAVRHWQAANNLHADGVVGLVTWHSMGLGGGGRRPTTAPTTAPAPSHTGVCEPYRGMLTAAGMPADYFLRIMWRESGCNPLAYNGRGLDRSYGLLQINTKSTPRLNLWGELQRRCGLTEREQLFDPATNIACAAALYRAYGTKPWRTR